MVISERSANYSDWLLTPTGDLYLGIFSDPDPGIYLFLLMQAYLEMPPVTRVYTTACVMTTLAVIFNHLHA